MPGLVMTGPADPQPQGKYDKLSKGDVGYGGNAFTPRTTSGVIPESLLSKRLRSLGVQTVPETKRSAEEEKRADTF